MPEAKPGTRRDRAQHSRARRGAAAGARQGERARRRAPGREGRTYAPEDARLCGLVDEVADEAEVVERACQVAETLAGIPPPSFALSQRHIRQPVRDLLDAHEARIDAEVMRVWTNPETRDAVRRYVERALGARA